MSGLIFAATMLALVVAGACAAVGLAVVVIAVKTAAGMLAAKRTVEAPVRLAAVGVPRQLGERRHGSRVTTFDGKPIGERLDSDVPGCDR